MSVKDPYKTLGVNRESTDAEVKKAYYELAKKYHPDNYADSPLSDLVEEKMKEINEAYDTIQRERASGGSGYAYAYEDSGSESDSGGGDFNNRDGWGSQASYNQVRNLINSRRYRDAEIILKAIPEAARGAQWQYLYGCILLGLGLHTDAVRYIETACYMDPSNVEYRTTRDNIKRNAAAYGRGYATGTGANSGGVCNLCSSLLCADCMCECCGGDLIPCC